jgi:hypothetical protein
MHNTRTMLSTYSQLINNNLHQPLEKIMDPLTNKQQQLITAFEAMLSHFGVGRPADMIEFRYLKPSLQNLRVTNSRQPTRTSLNNRSSVFANILFARHAPQVR